MYILLHLALWMRFLREPESKVPRRYEYAMEKAALFVTIRCTRIKVTHMKIKRPGC